MIKASRDFVCIRIDSYESEEAQKIVRSHLNGRFENTAFCILSPDGKERLTRSGRGPGQVFRGNLASSLNTISKKYRSRDKGAAVPDFPTFKLSLNVSSADQRLLLLVTGNDKELKTTRKHLQPFAEHPDIIGRFHYDFENDEKTWSKVLSKSKSGSRIMIVAADAFGQKGEVIKNFPLNVKLSDLKDALLKANESYAKNTTKKNYGNHIQKGRRNGVTWEMPMEYGEDRDGDGKIDHRGGAGRPGPRRR